MKGILLTLSILASSALSLADSNSLHLQKLYEQKLERDQKMFELKTQLEASHSSQKINDSLHDSKSLLNFDQTDFPLAGDQIGLLSVGQECAEWVYRGSASREESVRACRGVQTMDCVEWVYRGSASREESARACRGVSDMECVEWVYRGSASRVEAAQACSSNHCQ